MRTLLLGLVLAGGLCAAASAEESRVYPARGEVEVAFTPGDAPEAVILRTLAEARKAVYVQAYAFTSTPIADALIAARARGVKVEVLLDAQLNRRGGRALAKLLAARVPVFFETRYNAAHNKVMLIDPEGGASVVLTGSYNYTYSARERNAENLLALRGNAPLARDYLRNWRSHRAEAVEVHELPWSG